MLETIREYALERLVAGEAEEAETTRQRHARFFLALAQEAESELWGPRVAAWLERLEREHDNLRAALTWLTEEVIPTAGVGATEVALRLAGALGNYWTMRGHNSEGRDWLAAALAKSAGHRLCTRAELESPRSGRSSVWRQVQKGYGHFIL